MKRGVFITLEGIDGSGKTNAAQYIIQALCNKDIPLITTTEPSNTTLGIWSKVASEKFDFSEAIIASLYISNRSHHLATKIIPALEAGIWVVCDRFSESTYAYQNIPWKDIADLERILQATYINKKTILLSVSVETAIARICKRDDIGPRDCRLIPIRSFLNGAALKYQEMSKNNRIISHVINAEMAKKYVRSQIIEYVSGLVSDWRS